MEVVEEEKVSLNSIHFIFLLGQLQVRKKKIKVSSLFFICLKMTSVLWNLFLTRGFAIYQAKSSLVQG